MMSKTPAQWRQELPVVGQLMDLAETFWINPGLRSGTAALADCPLTAEDVADAEARLRRFAPYLAAVFPDTAPTGGIIESPLTPIPAMQKHLGDFPGQLLLKQDSHLPISGSIKARGGIYEILHLAEDIAVREGMLSLSDDYSVLAKPEFRALFGKYAVAVGSTGNLGLSIGIMSAQLGFKVTVHMSADARQWKKDMLRSKGVTVVEYADDYSKAVAEGRRQAEADPMCHFVDDENSRTLFLG
ncbi:MAG: D-serine ammonia-lyase, partial [Dysosmobacter welbionis]